MNGRIAALVCLAVFVGVDPAGAADPISDGQWFHTFLHVATAGSFSDGAGVTVAVVDSGIDAGHGDLSGTVVNGIDLVSPGDGRTDTNGHGTAMAGLIAAHGHVAGIAPAAKVLPIRISGSGTGTTDVLARGIRWAAEHGAQVISVSRAAQSEDPLLQQEVEQAIAHDVVVVAGVGNRPESQSVQYPAAIPGVLAVAGVDQNGNHSSVSVTGPEVVIAAPSDNISSTGLNGTWQVSTGTSDATAIVAGAVALVRSKFPQLKAADVVRRLTSTAIDKGSPGRDNEYGYGILNIVGALTAEATASSSPTKTTPPSQPANEEDQGQFRWWLIALPVTVAVAALGFYVWRRRLTTR